MIYNRYTRIEKLVKAFLLKGWVLEGDVDIASDWWFSEILHLRSKWRPTGTDIYLTLLTDPQAESKKIVWSVGISSKIPDNRLYNFIDQLTLNDISRTDLSSFVDNINKTILTDS